MITAEEFSKMKVYQDIKKEVEKEKEAEKNYLLGMSFLTGKDSNNQEVTKNKKVGLQYIEKASKLGNRKAKSFLIQELRKDIKS